MTREPTTIAACLSMDAPPRMGEYTAEVQLPAGTVPPLLHIAEMRIVRPINPSEPLEFSPEPLSRNPMDCLLCTANASCRVCALAMIYPSWKMIIEVAAGPQAGPARLAIGPAIESQLSVET